MDGHVRSFLDDILAHPHDDAPRLIFADWVEDHADAVPPDVRDRGQLIRVHYALEGVPDDDPRRPMLETRAAALIHQHYDAWARPFDRDRHRPTFRRGFVEGLSLMPEVDTPPRPGEHAPVRRLRLRTDSFTEFNLGRRRRQEERERAQRLVVSAGWPLLAQVDDLDLTDFAFSPGREAEWFAAADLSRVRTLAVTDAASAAALAAPRLRGVTHLTVSLAGAGLLSAPARALISLTLTRPDAQRVGAVLARFGPGLRRLTIAESAPIGAAASSVEHLDLSHSRVDAAALASDGPFPRLTRLVLKTCLFADADPWGALTPTAFPVLRSLNLRNLRHGGLDRLAASPLLGQLEALYLGYSRLGRDAVTDLLPRLPTGLRVLDLSWNALGDDAAAAVAAGDAAASLEMLDLSYCGLSPASAAALARLPDDAALVALNVGTNRLTTAGLRTLLAAGALDRLEALDVSNAHLDDDAADALLEWPRFRELGLLSLHGNDLSPRALVRLRTGFRGLLL